MKDKNKKNMKYSVVVPKKVQKEINKINEEQKQRILESLTVIEKDPFSGKKLQGTHKGKWSYRVWPYRIIYKIKKNQLIILIVHIGHCQEIY